MIYVITHKDFDDRYCNSFCTTLLVGANKNKCSTAKWMDNTGDNISDKNASFCELTGLYWIWKNSSDDIIGLCHYRRYFSHMSNYFPLCLSPTQRDVKRMLGKADLIAPRKLRLSMDGKLTVRRHYAQYHNISDWELTKQIITELYPDYLEDFLWYENQTEGYCFNMFVGKKSLMDGYCRWLFDILFELERRVDIDTYDAYNGRLFGFLSERLINVWIHHNDLVVKELNLFSAEPGFIEKNRQRVIGTIKRLKH
jgi:hypothetical protein